MSKAASKRRRKQRRLTNRKTDNKFIQTISKIVAARGVAERKARNN